MSSIERKLDALLALAAFDLMHRNDGLPSPTHRSLESLLLGAGLSYAEIGKTLGKSAEAARKQIDRDRKKAANSG
jgi:DNA-binding CsgD family transcriptional regulator